MSIATLVVFVATIREYLFASKTSDGRSLPSKLSDDKKVCTSLYELVMSFDAIDTSPSRILVSFKIAKNIVVNIVNITVKKVVYCKTHRFNDFIILDLTLINIMESILKV